MIQVKVFTMLFNVQLGLFDDEKFNDFAKDKELVSVNDYFFHRDGVFYLTLVVKYKPLSSLAIASMEKAQNKLKNNEEWRKLLDDNSMPLFNTLRGWRGERSRKEGVPPYIIFNNKQLAEICQKRPQSKHDLMKIEGIGKAKVERYGEDILKVTTYQKGEKKLDAGSKKSSS